MIFRLLDPKSSSERHFNATNQIEYIMDCPLSAHIIWCSGNFSFSGNNNLITSLAKSLILMLEYRNVR
jgi:hypothetical protein